LSKRKHPNKTDRPEISFFKRIGDQPEIANANIDIEAAQVRPVGIIIKYKQKAKKKLPRDQGREAKQSSKRSWERPNRGRIGFSPRVES